MKSRAELAELCKAASPGPWLVNTKHGLLDVGQLAADGDVYTNYELGDVGPEDERDTSALMTDLRFIAAARDALPALLAREERLERLLREAHKATWDATADDSPESLSKRIHQELAHENET